MLPLERGERMIDIPNELVKIFADHYEEISKDPNKKQGSLK